MEHLFTTNIKSILQKHHKKNADEIFEKSQLVQYINEKTRSAHKGSKARASFNSLYSIYTLVEDYLAKNYHKTGDYSIYEGAKFTDLLKRARNLPFGSKIQNHSFNNRTNDEFRKFDKTLLPILRDQQTKHYWINENLLKIVIGKANINIAKSIIDIIDNYVITKQDAFHRFMKSCQDMQIIEKTTPLEVQGFILGLLAPNIDARLFEIVSFSILKYFYHDQKIIWGYEIDNLNMEYLTLYKTGRTNANDGGIDFVMKPLGRFFQVTETVDFKKYFLDIDKIQKYPITFVIKSVEPKENLLSKIKDDAIKSYSIKSIVTKYMDCIEEVINIPTLILRFNEAVKQGFLNKILDEIVAQSKIEFNSDDDDLTKL